METTLNAINNSILLFQADAPLVKAKEHGWKTAAARMRKEFLKLERLLKQFRKVSVHEANK